MPPLTTDGLLYHLPFAVHYYKTGSISFPNLYFTDIAMTYYPIGGEIFYLFSIFSGKEFLFKYTQFPFLILSCLTLFLLLKSLTFSDLSSVLCACIFSLIRPVFKESCMEFVDLIMAGSFISSLYFFNKKEKKYLIPGLLSLSILLSTKTLSLISGILTLPFLFFKKEGKTSKSIYFLIIYLLFFGLFSYWRNLILTGNPFYPAEISIRNFVIFKGAYVYPKISIFQRLKTLSHILSSSFSHIDPPVNNRILFLLFFIISLISSFKEKKLFILFLILPLTIFLYSLLVPATYFQIRHFLPLYSIISISLIYPFRRKEYFCIPVYLYICISVFPSIMLPKFLIIFLLLSIFLFIPSYFKKRILYLISLFFFLFILIFEIGKTETIYPGLKFEIWKAFYKEEGNLWEFVQKNSINGKNIAYIGSFFIYPLYGEKFNNNVFYQSVNSIDSFPVYKYKKKIKFPEENPENLYRENPSYQLWLKGVKDKKIDWIVVKKTGYIEEKWIEENLSIFKQIYSFQNFLIYEFSQKFQCVK